jgi:glycerol-3-phosphate dehydrogenase (NAD(P)+)
MSRRVAVFGAGSWGTAFALVLADAGCEVTLWGRRAALVDAINATHSNPDYLPDVTLPANVRATTDPAEAAREADIAVLAVSAQHLRRLLEDWAGQWRSGTVFVSLMKGVELDSGKLMSEVIAETTGAPPARIAVVSGPNLAAEIVARKPAASVVACADAATAELIQAACHTQYFRPYTNPDVRGCELGVAMGAEPLTLAGLAGMGDLVATCASRLSRNHAFGYRIGSGMTVAQAREATTQTAEGVASCLAVRGLAERYGVEMPITQTVVDIVHGGQNPEVAVRALMSRTPKPEAFPRSRPARV